MREPSWHAASPWVRHVESIMADITISCPKCKRDITVSEYVAGTSVRCPACESSVALPDAEPRGGLQLKRQDRRRTLAGPESDESAPAIAATEANPYETEQLNQALKSVHKVRRKIDKPKIWIGWLVCLALTAMMLWMQHAGQSNLNIRDNYLMIRLFIGLFVYIMVLIVAFQDGYLQGILCLLVAPYTIYYAFVRLERPVLTGLVVAMSVSLGAEMHYMKDQATITLVQDALQVFIEGGAQTIENLSAEPEF